MGIREYLDIYAKAGDPDDCGHEPRGGEFTLKNTCAEGGGIRGGGGSQRPIRSAQIMYDGKIHNINIDDSGYTLDLGDGKTRKLDPSNRGDQFLIRGLDSQLAKNGILPPKHEGPKKPGGETAPAANGIRGSIGEKIAGDGELDRKARLISSYFEKDSDFHTLKYEELKDKLKDMLDSMAPKEKAFEDREARIERVSDLEARKELKSLNRQLKYHATMRNEWERYRLIAESINGGEKGEIRSKIVNGENEFISHQINRCVEIMQSMIGPNRSLDLSFNPIGDARAGAIKMGGRTHIILSKYERNDVIFHEMAHAVEHAEDRVRRACEEFLKYRTAGSPDVNLSEVFPANGYKEGESGNKDHFDRYFNESNNKGPSTAYYCGKPSSGASTEILSMGLQALVSDASAFIRDDPEYAKFVIGILDSSLL